MSLTELQDSVVIDADHHHPDIIFDPTGQHHNMFFRVLPMKEIIDENEENMVGLVIDSNIDDHVLYETRAHMFTRWSRHQLLAFFGAREKWFSFVDLERQADELNARVGSLAGHCIRTMRPFDEDFPIHIVRGIVSAEYVDIPNVAIMEAMVARMPSDACALRYHSGITDRAFYAYVFSPDIIAIPGTKFIAHPGALVRNSEVGHTSLSITPCLVTPTGQPIVAKEHVMLRRVHRGRDLDLMGLFEGTFDKCATLWKGMSSKIMMLSSKTYPDTDNAVATMQRLLIRAEARKDFIALCTQKYRNTRSGQTRHTALDIFEVVTEVCATFTDRDESYELGAIAGAVLFRLVLT
jgi:hypothetical protein